MCGCMCHQIEYPRYADTDGVVVCKYCLGDVYGWEMCETVREELEAEQQAVKLEYMKAKGGE